MDIEYAFVRTHNKVFAIVQWGAHWITTDFVATPLHMECISAHTKQAQLVLVWKVVFCCHHCQLCVAYNRQCPDALVGIVERVTGLLLAVLGL
jgi:hypothetical protein